MVWGQEAKPSVGSGSVVVLRVGAKDTFEMPPSKHKQPVQAFGAGRPHPAFRERVRSRCSHWSLYDLHVFATEDLIERAAELGVSVMDQESHTRAPIVEVHEQVARLLGYPGRVRVSGDTEDCHSPGVKLDGEKDV
jgi:hypothetical protein